MSSVIDLTELAGKRWRVSRDPSATIDTSKSEAPHYVRLEGRYGFVSPWSRHELAAYTSAARLVKRLLALPGARPLQIGDREARVAIPPASLDAACELVRARRRRRVTDAERARLRLISPLALSRRAVATPSRP